MKGLLLLVYLSVAQAAAFAGEQFLSPDKRFEAYTTGPNGAKIYLRGNGVSSPGDMVASTVSGGFTAQWSPDSRFVVVIHNFFDRPPTIFHSVPAGSTPGRICLT